MMALCSSGCWASIAVSSRAMISSRWCCSTARASPRKRRPMAWPIAGPRSVPWTGPRPAPWTRSPRTNRSPSPNPRIKRPRIVSRTAAHEYEYTAPVYIPPDAPIEEEDDDEEDERDEIAFFDGPACQEYRELSKRFSRPDYVVDEALKHTAHRPYIASTLPRLEKLNPRNIEHARQRLTLVIDEFARRLRQIRAQHIEIATADDARANERLAFDPSPKADKERRYILAHDRMCNQTLGTWLKVRKATHDGSIGEIDSRAVSLSNSIRRGDLAAVSPARRSARVRDAAGRPSQPATDPSLALRAGMAQPAPAEDEPIHTSPNAPARGLRNPAPERGRRNTKNRRARNVANTCRVYGSGRENRRAKRTRRAHQNAAIRAAVAAALGHGPRAVKPACKRASALALRSRHGPRAVKLRSRPTIASYRDRVPTDRLPRSLRRSSGQARCRQASQRPRPRQRPMTEDQ